MTEEEIRAEVERRYNEKDRLGDDIRANVYKSILRFIDSMQEEPVSIDFEQELYKAFGQVKDFTLGMRIAKWFYDMGRKHQEPVSEDLEDFALQYAGHHAPYDDCMQEVEDAVKAGAKWQKEQDKQWLAVEHKNIFAKGRESMKQQMIQKADLNEKKDVYPQSQWKPSKIQMSALKVASGLVNIDMQAILYSLYNDLKKL